MNGFDCQGDGTLDSEDIERKPPGSSSRKWALRSSFVGLQAIRSGWGMLIFTMILVVEVLVTRVPVNHLLHSMKHNPSLEPGVTTVPYAVPLMRASEMRTMSVIPRLRSFEGKLILPTALLKIGMVSEVG